MRAIAILIPMLIMGCGKKVPDHQAQQPVTPKPKTPKVEPPPLLNGGRGFEGDLRRVDTVHVGDMAPDFELKTPDGKRTVSLRMHRGKRPVALLFGSYTWDVFRAQVDPLLNLYERYKTDVAFYMVYIEEAHPSDGWVARNNVQAGISVAKAVNFSERASVAKTCAATLKLPMSTLVDTIDNAVNYKYSAWPDRIYVVDVQGRIALQAAHGPFGFKPGVEATAAWLAKNGEGREK